MREAFRRNAETLSKRKLDDTIVVHLFLVGRTENRQVPDLVKGEMVIVDFVRIGLFLCRIFAG